MLKMYKKDRALHDKFTEYGLNPNLMSDNDKSLHEKFVEYGSNAKEWMRKCVFLLPEIEKRRIWEKKGFSSIFEYASKLAGMSRNKVEDSLRILRKMKDKPEIAKVAIEKGINSIRPVISIATKENEKYWAEKARIMSKNTLEAFVNGCGSGKNDKITHQQAIFENFDRTSTGTIIPMEISPETAEKLEKLKGRGSWDDLMKEFIEMREKKLEEEKIKAVEKAAKAQKDSKEPVSRHIPNAIKRHILNKTSGLCAFPGCLKNGEILHHTNRFALEKVHDPDKIVLLCKAHERLAHLGLIQNEDGPPEKWRIREKPDRDYENSAKFRIDQVVNRFRNPIINSS